MESRDKGSRKIKVRHGFVALLTSLRRRDSHIWEKVQSNSILTLCVDRGTSRSSNVDEILCQNLAFSI